MSILSRQRNSMLTFNRTLWNWNNSFLLENQIAAGTFNRTLWNWNWNLFTIRMTLNKPLIEPYGIEISICLWKIDTFCTPLIEPYGIEITLIFVVFLSDVLPLIEPYGIEISFSAVINSAFSIAFNRTLWNWNIWWDYKSSTSVNTFNRTLWNWNPTIKPLITVLFTPLIEPYGIEIIQHNKTHESDYSFNRTLWNWNSLRSCSKSNESSFNRTLWNWNLINSI